MEAKMKWKCSCLNVTIKQINPVFCSVFGFERWLKDPPLRTPKTPTHLSYCSLMHTTLTCTKFVLCLVTLAELWLDSCCSGEGLSEWSCLTPPYGGPPLNVTGCDTSLFSCGWTTRINRFVCSILNPLNNLKDASSGWMFSNMEAGTQGAAAKTPPHY